MNPYTVQIQRYELLIIQTRRQLAKQSSDKEEKILYYSRYLSDLYDAMRIVRHASNLYTKALPRTRYTSPTKGEYDEQ
jgi:hypothetical protein